MNAWRESVLGDEIELAYGKALPAHSRIPGATGVYGSNGVVGTHETSLINGPGIVIGRKGTVGAVTYSADAFWPIDTTYYVVNKTALNWRYLFHLLCSVGLSGMNSHSAIPGLNREDVYSVAVQIPSADVQGKIADALDFVLEAVELEILTLSAAEELQRAATSELLATGLRSGPTVDTETGALPSGWVLQRLDVCAEVISTRMQYRQLEELAPATGEDTLLVLGVKVSDMNRSGNEVELHDAALTVPVPRMVAEQRCAPPGTIIFPKRGAAIATNKKRLATNWTVFDPNVIGVRARPGLDQRFLFHWFQAFDLRSIVEPGPTPQLNKKNLDPLRVPVPADMKEQQQIASILDATATKVDVHRRRRSVLEELFYMLQTELISGRISVDDLDLAALNGRQPHHYVGVA